MAERIPINIDEFVHHASQAGATALYVKEAMSLPYSESYVNRLIKRYVGTRPTWKSIQRPNPMRDAVVAYMESQGLDKRYCSSCHRRLLRDCAIHPLKRYGASLDDFVFVCTERCAAPGDY